MAGGALVPPQRPVNPVPQPEGYNFPSRPIIWVRIVMAGKKRRWLWEMTTMELLAIPGMNNSRKLHKMTRESQKRMSEAARCQMIAAAMMSANSSSKQKKR